MHTDHLHLFAWSHTYFLPSKKKSPKSLSAFLENDVPATSHTLCLHSTTVIGAVVDIQFDTNNHDLSFNLNALDVQNFSGGHLALTCLASWRKLAIQQGGKKGLKMHQRVLAGRIFLSLFNTFY